jgi:hypothetical protein
MHTTGHWLVTLVVIILIIVIGFIVWGKGTSQKNFAEQQGGPDVAIHGTPWNDVKNNGNWMMILGAILVIGGILGLLNLGIHAYREGMFESMGGYHAGYKRRHRYY